MRILFILLVLICSGCNFMPDYASMARPGVMYHYSANTYYKCSKCNKDTHLFRRDTKDRIVCKECFKKEKNKGLYH